MAGGALHCRSPVTGPICIPKYFPALQTWKWAQSVWSAWRDASAWRESVCLAGCVWRRVQVVTPDLLGGLPMRSARIFTLPCWAKDLVLTTMRRTLLILPSPCFLPVEISRRRGKAYRLPFYDLLQSFSVHDWGGTLVRKNGFLKSDPCCDWVLSPPLDNSLCVLLKQLGVRCTTAVIKSWANAWTTSTRMHESERLSCIFGCGGDDCLDHYLVCDPLWTAVISTSFKRAELLWTRPMIKLGLIDTSIEWLQMTSVAFACYHSMKMSHLPEILQALESGDPYKVHIRLMNYAKAHFDDMRTT